MRQPPAARRARRGHAVGHAATSSSNRTSRRPRSRAAAQMPGIASTVCGRARAASQPSASWSRITAPGPSAVAVRSDDDLGTRFGRVPDTGRPGGHAIAAPACRGPGRRAPKAVGGTEVRRQHVPARRRPGPRPRSRPADARRTPGRGRPGCRGRSRGWRSGGPSRPCARSRPGRRAPGGRARRTSPGRPRRRARPASRASRGPARRRTSARAGISVAGPWLTVGPNRGAVGMNAAAPIAPAPATTPAASARRPRRARPAAARRPRCGDGRGRPSHRLVLSHRLGHVGLPPVADRGAMGCRAGVFSTSRTAASPVGHDEANRTNAVRADERLGFGTL